MAYLLEVDKTEEEVFMGVAIESMDGEDEEVEDEEVTEEDEEDTE